MRGDASRRSSVLMWVKRWLHVARIIRLGYNIYKCAVQPSIWLISLGCFVL